MVWACLAAAGIGLLAGMRFKAPVMLVLALMVVVGTVAVAMVFFSSLRAAKSHKSRTSYACARVAPFERDIGTVRATSGS